jgi:hypothetical protein
MNEKFSRRDALQRGATLGVLALVGMTACGKKTMRLSCIDTTGLAPADLQVRTALAYVDVSIDPAKTCTECQQFLPGAPNACGACKVVKGPINPRGSCKSFVAKPVA